MKQVVLWIFVVYWFAHLALGAGAGFASLRLWNSRKNPFILRVALFMQSLVISALLAIVLVFLARGVKLTWKFSIAWFAGYMLMGALQVPLIVFLLKGTDESKTVAQPVPIEPANQNPT